MLDVGGSQKSKEQISAAFEKCLRKFCLAAAGCQLWEAQEWMSWGLLRAVAIVQAGEKAAPLGFEIYFGSNPRTYWWMEFVEWGKEKTRGWYLGFLLNMASPAIPGEEWSWECYWKKITVLSLYQALFTCFMYSNGFNTPNNLMS